MNERLQLFVDNVEKIRLYFGPEGEKFTKKMATQLTVRNIRFYYQDYEDVQTFIKKNTKWYSHARASVKIAHAYYIHFAKEPEKIPQVLQFYQTLLTTYRRTEDSYLAAIYMTSHEDLAKIKAITHAMIKQPSLRYSALPLSSRAMLASRPESPDVLASTYERYYNELLNINFKRGGTTKNAALLLTMSTGTFNTDTWKDVVTLAQLIEKANTKLEERHYSVVCLLALAKFEPHEFPALTDIHDEICKKIKANPKYENTLLIAAQVYTANEIIGELPKYDIDFTDILLIDSDNHSGDSSGDSGGGGD